MQNLADPLDRVTYCDVCCLRTDGHLEWRPNARQANWDGPTKRGLWGYMCEEHLKADGFPGYKGNIDIRGRQDGRKEKA